MKLETYLIKERLTQAEFGRRVGVSRSRVNEWLRGRYVPSLNSVANIERVTGGAVTLYDFVKLKDRDQRGG